MSKLNATVGALLVACALGLVTSQHRARKLFLELEHAQLQMRELEVVWDKLQVEQSALAKPALIDATARRALKMEQVGPSRSLYLPLAPAKVRDGQGSSEAARPAARLDPAVTAGRLARHEIR